MACQIGDVAHKFGAAAGIRKTVLYGGSNKAGQIGDLERGVSLVIATPGRLIDLINNGYVNLRRCSYFVLDEGRYEHF